MARARLPLLLLASLQLLPGRALAQQPAEPPPSAPVAQLQAIVAQVPDLRGVAVGGEGAVLRLQGEVPSPEVRQQLVQAARGLPGVRYVDDQLRLQEQAAPVPVDTDAVLAGQLRGVLAAVDELAEVQVSVRSGVVHLQGQVATTAAQQQARSLASGLEGVLYVDDDTVLSAELEERLSPAVRRIRGMLAALVQQLPLLGVGAVLLGLSGLLARLVWRTTRLFRRLEDQSLLQAVLRRSLSVAILLVGIFGVLELLELTALAGALLGTAGVAGIALGFAFKDIVENYLATLLLSLRHPFRRGDIVEIEGRQGSVARMTTRDTVLLTFEGNHVRIPNAQVFRSTLTNFSTNPLRRLDFTVGVGTEDNLLEVRRLGLEVLAGVEGVLAEPAPFMLIDELGDSNVRCHFYAWIDQRGCDLLAVRSECIRRIKVAFLQQGFDLPEPIYRLHIRSAPPPARAVFEGVRAEEPAAEPVAAPVQEEAPHGQIADQLRQEEQRSKEGDLLSSEEQP